MSEASVVAGLVDDHGIFHILTGIRDDCNDCVDSGGIIGHAILLELVRLKERNLWSGIDEGFIVETILSVVIGNTESLLGHLTLVHISGRLVMN